VNISRTFG